MTGGGGDSTHLYCPVDCLEWLLSDIRWNSPLLTFLSKLEPNRKILAAATTYNSSLDRDSPSRISTATDDFESIESSGDFVGFEEFFCLAMECLDRVYLNTNAGYMDFPVVIKRVEKIVSRE